jgi:hypothetical protein
MALPESFWERVVPSTVRHLEKKIDLSLKDKVLDSDGHCIVTQWGEFDKRVMDIVVDDYLKTGKWVKIIYRFYSENGKSGMFTQFDFYSK